MLKEKEVREILRKRGSGKFTLKELAEKYNCTRAQICNICNGKAHKEIYKEYVDRNEKKRKNLKKRVCHVSYKRGPKGRFKPKQIEKILLSSLSHVELAKRFNTLSQTIYEIRIGKLYADIAPFIKRRDPNRERNVKKCEIIKAVNILHRRHAHCPTFMEVEQTVNKNRCQDTIQSLRRDGFLKGKFVKWHFSPRTLQITEKGKKFLKNNKKYNNNN